MTSICTSLLFVAVLLASAPAESLPEVVLYGPPPGAAKEAYAALVEDLREVGLKPIWRRVEDIRADRERVHIVLDAATLPLSLQKTVTAAILDRGRWIFLGTPAFSDPVIVWEGKQRKRSVVEKLLAGIQPSFIAAAPALDKPQRWTRSTNTPDRPARNEVVETDRGPALHAVIENLNGWDTLGYPEPLTIPKGHNLVTFWARGEKETKALVIEFQERDGSRWLATVPLGTAWRYYVLSENDFAFWESVPARKHSHLVLSQSRLLRVGLAFSHSGPRPGRKEYWLGAVGTAQRELPAGLMREPAPFPGLCPAYKFYETDADFICPIWDTSGPGGNRFPSPSHRLTCLHMRPTGKGIEKGRPFRFLPLSYVTGKGAGDLKGMCAALFVGSAAPYRGCAWASFPQPGRLIAGAPHLRCSVVDAARALAFGVLLTSAGSDRFTYFSDQTVTVGADLVNLRNAAVTLTLDLRVERNGAPDVVRKRSEIRLEPLGEKQVRHSIAAAAVGRRAFFGARLLSKERLLDALGQRVDVYRAPEKPAFTVVKDGHFERNGKRWRPHGINYMPSSGIGLEDYRRFERWLGGPAYDPLVIRRDLSRLKKIGFDAVSVFLYAESHDAGNLVDLLYHCRNLDLTVNLSLRPGTPLKYEWADWRRMIVENRLAEDDTIFTYDIAWEPSFRSLPERHALDPLWHAWIIRRYGSVEKAEAVWGFKAPRANGSIAGPSGQQLWNEGPWRVMVCAYRRFMDHLLGKCYRVAYRRIKDVDPNHLVSYRMAESGDPTFRQENHMPYGFQGSARAMDFLAPEAYGRIGSWEEMVRPGVFTVAYGRAVAPKKPVVWAEVGMSIWDRAQGITDPVLAGQQARYFEDIYRLLRLSDADGVFFWWYPGGFRCGEVSDYGLINPDGTWRPATAVINRFSREGWGPAPSAGSLLKVDRDAYASGLWGMWRVANEPFLREVEAGKLPRLRLWPENMTSATMPPRAIGNLRLPDGIVPACLNGLWEKVTAEPRTGFLEGSVDCTFGGRVTPRGSQPVTIRASVYNTGPCRWLHHGSNAVVAVLTSAAGTTMQIPLPRDVPYLEAAECTFTLPPAPATWDLYLMRRDGLRFGERLRIEVNRG